MKLLHSAVLAKESVDAGLWSLGDYHVVATMLPSSYYRLLPSGTSTCLLNESVGANSFLGNLSFVTKTDKVYQQIFEFLGPGKRFFVEDILSSGKDSNSFLASLASIGFDRLQMVDISSSWISQLKQAKIYYISNFDKFREGSKYYMVYMGN